MLPLRQADGLPQRRLVSFHVGGEIPDHAVQGAPQRARACHRLRQLPRLGLHPQPDGPRSQSGSVAGRPRPAGAARFRRDSLQSQRPDDQVANRTRVPLARRAAQHPPEQPEAEVGVRRADAGIGRQSNGAERAQQVVRAVAPVGIHPEHMVAKQAGRAQEEAWREPGEARGVGGQMPERDRRLFRRRLDPGREEIRHTAVETHEAVAGHAGQQDARERLGDRADLEERFTERRPAGRQPAATQRCPPAAAVGNDAHCQPHGPARAPPIGDLVAQPSVEGSHAPVCPEHGAVGPPADGRPYEDQPHESQRQPEGAHPLRLAP